MAGDGGARPVKDAALTGVERRSLLVRLVIIGGHVATVSPRGFPRSKLDMWFARSMKLDFRPWGPDDAPTFGDWQRDAVFCSHAGWSTAVQDTPSAVQAWRAQIVGSGPALVRLLAFDQGHPVGYVDLYDEPSSSEAIGELELGFAVAPSSNWGQGLGTAIAREGLRQGFLERKTRRIWAEAPEAHGGSVRTLRSVGMRESKSSVGGPAEFRGVSSRYLTFELARDQWTRMSAERAR